MKSLKYQAKMLILLSIITIYNFIKVFFIWRKLTKKILDLIKKFQENLKTPRKI